MEPKVEGITELLRNIRGPIGRLYEMLAPEIMRYDMIEADLEVKVEKMKNIDRQRDAALLEIEQAKNAAIKIKEIAREESARTTEDVRSVLAENLDKSRKHLQDVDQFVTEVDKKRYKNLLKEQEKMEAVA